MQSHRFAFAWLLLAAAACGGGGSSPTEPSPSPGNVSLAGSWAGTVRITSPGSAAATCSLSLSIQSDVEGFFGNWDARCPDGSQGNEIAFAQPAFSNLVILIGASSSSVFSGCSWSSVATQTGRRLQGDWGVADNCQTGPVLRGRLDLTKQN